MIEEAFLQQRAKLKLTKVNEIKKFLDGKTIEIIDITGGHNYGPIGSRIKFDNIKTALVTTESLSYGITNGNTISYNKFRVVISETISNINNEISIIKESIKESKEEIDLLESRKNFMKENGVKEFDEDQFKAFHVLELLEEPRLTRIKKAELIAKLINQ